MDKVCRILNTILCYVLIVLGIILAGNGLYRFIESMNVIEFSSWNFFKYIVIGIVLTVIGCILIACSKRKLEINHQKKKKNYIIPVLISFICVTLGGIAFAYEMNDFNKIVYDLEWFTTGHGGVIAAKPIIYIYTESATEVTVKLGKKEKITCSYPKYQDEWKVIAYPDGTLVDKMTNKKLYALYWEGKRDVDIPMNDGFIVKGEDSSRFLEEKLAILGLNEKETEEFIIYWLPKLEANKYNLIRFETMEEIEQNMPLTISKTPDTLVRVWMQFKGIETSIEIPEQHLEYHNRTGFTVVEWGGTEVK